MLSLSAALWLVAPAAGAQTCAGEEFETRGLTAACENGVMVYRGYAQKPAVFPGPDDDTPGRQSRKAAETDETAGVSVKRYYLWTALLERRSAPPDAASPRRLVWQNPAPRPRMIRMESQ